MSSEVPVLSTGNGYSITKIFVNLGRETTLDIETFRMDQSGYYWCRLLDVQIGETANRHQSQVEPAESNGIPLYYTFHLYCCTHDITLMG